MLNGKRLDEEARDLRLAYYFRLMNASLCDNELNSVICLDHVLSPQTDSQSIRHLVAALIHYYISRVCKVTRDAEGKGG